MPHVNHGRFVWIDLMSKEPARDRAFLERLAGLRVEEQDMGTDVKYPMLLAGDLGVGGINAMPEGESHPSHWIGYVVVTDIAATLAAVEAAGGQVVVPTMDIPAVGQFAVVRDPQGAFFSPLQPSTDADMIAPGPLRAGQFCWWELHTTDVQGAKDFYGKVIGWGSHDVDMGGQPYGLWLQGDSQNNPGGLMAAGSGQPPMWLYYLLVPDVDASTAQVTSLGGQVIEGPNDVPGQGRMTVITLPSGAPMAIFTGLSQDQESSEPAQAAAS